MAQAAVFKQPLCRLMGNVQDACRNSWNGKASMVKALLCGIRVANSDSVRHFRGEGAMNILQRFWFIPLLLGACAIATSTVEAQVLQPPPNNGFNATIALPSTIDAFWTGVNAGLEKAGDGLDRLAGSKDANVGKGLGSFGSLRPGTPVAVQYAVKGIQASPDWQPNGANINEGTVTRVDRGRKQITIQYANGGTEILHSDNSFTAHSSRVIVHYADESGRQVAHAFKPAH